METGYPRAGTPFLQEGDPLPAKTLAEALLAVQQNAPALQKSAINPHFKSKYISLDTLMPAILPLLNEQGLVLSQFPTFVQTAAGAESALRTRITHAPTGEWAEDTMLLVLGKNDPQGQGSGLTYARRYAVLAILGLVADTDDDGNKATEGRRAASDPLAALKRQVVDLAKERLDKSRPTPSEIAKLFGVKQADLAKADVLEKIVAEHAA